MISTCTHIGSGIVVVVVVSLNTKNHEVVILSRHARLAPAAGTCRCRESWHLSLFQLACETFQRHPWNSLNTSTKISYFNIQRWRRRISSATSTPGPRDGTGVWVSVSSLALELGRQNFDGFGFGDFGKTVFQDVWRFLVSFGSTNVLWCVLSRHSTKRFKTWDPGTAEVELMALQKLHADMQEEKAARNCRVIQSWVTGSYSSQYSTWLSSLVALSDDSLSGLLLDFHTCQICITRKCLSWYVLSFFIM